MSGASSLFEIHADIDMRVASVRRHRPEWPCSKGCDSCCRRLADVPRLTRVEWDLLREGLAALAAPRLEEISTKIRALAAGAVRPVVCPMLDESSGACPVYAHRPVACRTYGFFVDRDKGLYCRDIEALVEGGGLDEVVWGNHEVIERRLTAFEPTRTLTDWFLAWQLDQGLQP
ncbi:MAG: YkgJ family cysteine cluster protein [Zoogloea sp.]|nr:YkgJ family cysteine cluster protein [Zoogloea sp.]